MNETFQIKHGMTRDDRLWLATAISVGCACLFLGAMIGFGCGRFVDRDRDKAVAEMYVDMGDTNFYDIGQVHRMRLFDKGPEGPQ